MRTIQTAVTILHLFLAPLPPVANASIRYVCLVMRGVYGQTERSGHASLFRHNTGGGTDGGGGGGGGAKDVLSIGQYDRPPLFDIYYLDM